MNDNGDNVMQTIISLSLSLMGPKPISRGRVDS